MTIHVGTIQEMSGKGFEILVDEATRTLVLAKFFEGRMITSESSAPCGSNEITAVAA